MNAITLRLNERGIDFHRLREFGVSITRRNLANWGDGTAGAWQSRGLY